MSPSGAKSKVCMSFSRLSSTSAWSSPPLSCTDDDVELLDAEGVPKTPIRPEMDDAKEIRVATDRAMLPSVRTKFTLRIGVRSMISPRGAVAPAVVAGLPRRKLWAATNSIFVLPMFSLHGCAITGDSEDWSAPPFASYSQINDSQINDRG